VTDRKLLELAAKAYGIDLYFGPTGAWITPTVDITNVEWNPLTDDCDALRLAVKLGFKIVHWGNNPLNKSVAIYKSQEPAGPLCFERHDEDPYAATRRAIVRAAAEIGRKSA
jgi:hypothetical protein